MRASSFVFASCLVAFASVSTDSLAAAAPITGPVTAVAITPAAPGSLSFAVNDVGAVSAKVLIDADATVSLRDSSNQEVNKVTGKGTMNVSSNATLNQVAHGKLWSVVVTPALKATSTTAKIQVTAPGGQFSFAEVASLPEVTSLPKQIVAPKLAAPPVKPSSNELALTAAKGMQSKGLSVNVNAIGAAPIKVANNVPAPVAAPSTPQRRYAQITQVVVEGKDGPHTCNGVAYCRVSGGDTLTIIGDGVGGGFTGAAQQVHFVYLPSNGQSSDLTVPPIVWSIGTVMAQVPMRPGIGVQDGAIYLGDPNGSVISTPYGFHYSPRYVNDFVAFDKALYPSTQKLWRAQIATSTLTTGGLIASSSGPGALADKNTLKVTYTSMAMFSGSSFDEILPGLVLKNGWTVSNVFFSPGATARGGVLNLTQSHVGTSDASARVDWTINGSPAGIYYEMQVAVTGEDGTTYY